MIWTYEILYTEYTSFISGFLLSKLLLLKPLLLKLCSESKKMDTLPAEVLAVMVRHLDQRSICAMMRTCRSWRGLYTLHKWEIASHELPYIPEHLCRHVHTLRLEGALALKSAKPNPSPKQVFGFLRRHIHLFTRLHTLHLNRRWAKEEDSNTLVPKLPVHSLYIYEYGQELPTKWPETMRVLVIRDMFTTHIEGNLGSLQTLDCGNSRMEIINGIRPSLVELYVRGTQLMSVPDFCTNIKRLNLSCTRVKTVPNLPKLTHLDVSRTRVKSLPDTLVNLVHLNISRTSIRKISPAYTKLRVLKAQECPLLEIPSTYADVVVLSVKATGIVSLPSMVQLQKLDIRKTSLDPLSAGCKALKRISVDKNAAIPAGFIPVKRRVPKKQD